MRLCIKSEPPPFRHWVNRVNEIKLIEDHTSNLRGTETDFERKWQPWIELLQGIDI